MKYLFILLALLNMAATSSTNLTISGVVPTILKVQYLDNNKVRLQANAPRQIIVENGTLSNCDLNSIILDVICDIEGTDVNISMISL